MIDYSAIRPDDRVLILEIPPPEVVLAISRRLEAGLLVGIGPQQDVLTARRSCAECQNVMLVPSDPMGVIPWQDRFFSLVVGTAAELESAEVSRVLAPSGRRLVLSE